MKRRCEPWPLAPVILGCLLAGCTTIEDATEDLTRLQVQNVPRALGRALAVEVTGADEATAADLLAALRNELISRDLFDLVFAGAPSIDSSALRLVLQETSVEEVWDFWEFDDAYLVRYEAEAELSNRSGQQILTGHVSGIGVDRIASLADEEDLREELAELEEAARDPELTPEERTELERERLTLEASLAAQLRLQEDVRLAAVQDVGLKLARKLRETADQQARAAFRELAEQQEEAPIQLEPGVGPVEVALFGLDELGDRVPRGRILAQQVGRALLAQGADFVLTAERELQQAESELPAGPREAWETLGRDEFLSLVGRGLSQSLLGTSRNSTVIVLAEVELVGETLTGRLFAYDGERNSLTNYALEETETGLGALRVVAARLGRRLALAIQDAL